MPAVTSSAIFVKPANLEVFHSFPTRRSSDLSSKKIARAAIWPSERSRRRSVRNVSSQPANVPSRATARSEEHTSELQSLAYLVCRLLLEKKNQRETHEPAPARPPGPQTQSPG